MPTGKRRKLEKTKLLWSTANKPIRLCCRQLMGRTYLWLELFCLEQLYFYRNWIDSWIHSTALVSWRLAFLSTACKNELYNQINYEIHRLLPEILHENDWKGWGRNRNALTLSVNMNLRRRHAETMKWLRSLHWYQWNIIHAELLQVNKTLVWALKLTQFRRQKSCITKLKLYSLTCQSCYFSQWIMGQNWMLMSSWSPEYTLWFFGLLQK